MTEKTEPKESIKQSIKNGPPDLPEQPPKLQPQPNQPPKPTQTQSAPMFVGNGNQDDASKEAQEELYQTRKVSHGLKKLLNETLDDTRFGEFSRT